MAAIHRDHRAVVVRAGARGVSPIGDVIVGELLDAEDPGASRGAYGNEDNRDEREKVQFHLRSSPQS
jgi:hypothetical protein